MEISDINPIAVIGGVLGVIIGFIILRGMGGMNLIGEEVAIGLIWKILIPVTCGIGGFFIVQRMVE